MALPQRTDWMTLEELTLIAEQLEDTAVAFRAIIAAIADLDEPGVYSFGFWSGMEAKKRLDAFAADVKDAVQQLQAGQPYDGESSKKRMNRAEMQRDLDRRRTRYKQGKHRPQ